MTKNTHMEHIEDLIINEGYVGGIKALRHLLDLRESFDNVTVKWDGAPAIFFGVDPTDRRFFVAKKGIFNKNPKVYKSVYQITSELQGDLCMKMVQAFQWLEKLNISEGVYQGDLMWTADDVTDGSVHPNTLMYEIPESLTHKFGIVVHTKYQGSSFETMRAKFIKKIPDWMTLVDGLWIRGAGYEGQRTEFNINDRIGQLFDILNKIDTSYLDGLAASELSQQRLKCFINTFIRSNSKIEWNQFRSWNNAYYNAEMDKRKTEKGKATVEAKRKEVDRTVVDFFDHQFNLLSEFYLLMIEAKSEIIDVMNRSSSGPSCYFLHKDGLLEETNPEGYVSISKHGAVKLVDRWMFSRANFSDELIKGWEK